jgi:hypothetical protein
MLDQIINLKHEPAQLAAKSDWDLIDGEINPLHSDRGRLGIPTCADGVGTTPLIHQRLLRHCIRAGVPKAFEPIGMSRFTNEFAPMITLSPMVRPIWITALGPI